ncbi:MAG TPA: amidase [Candidatus Binatia bacterium]|nr:amidase [Candidatus Binatia bacterium]
MADPCLGSATALLAALGTRELRSRDLLERYLDRVARLGPKLNAVVTLDAERAREAADRADRTLASGGAVGPLHGLPITVKDTLETAGLRTTAGAEVFSGHVPATDATAVARLRAAGAVVFGKTNTPTFAADVQTYNPVFGTTNNPWDLARSPGGSSGGSAAATAAGLSGLELGSDIGGSIRTPAHYCGVYGHKPTYGIVPTRGHIPGPPGTLAEVDIAVVGPLARAAEDLDLALSVLAGPDEERATAWRLELPPPRHARLQDYRVAAWLDEPSCPVDAAVRERHEAIVAALARAGVRVDDRARPAVPFAEAYRDYRSLLWPIMLAEMPADQFEALAGLAASASGDDAPPAVDFARAATIRHRDWLAVNEARARYRAAWRDFFARFDVLLCPIVPTAAIPHDQSQPLDQRTITVNGRPRPYLDQIAWAGLIGMAWLPATMAPAGRTKEGLPVGVQIVGPYLEDRTPIEFARLLADVAGGFTPPPGY